MDIRVILMVLSWLFCTADLTGSCSSSEYEHAGICCKKCRPGTFVLTHCSETTETVCEACKNGTFSKDWTSSKECSRCSQPALDFIPICNATHDNECGCIRPHQYHHFPTTSCRECKRCPAGKYPVGPCTDDTFCATCPKDHFSNSSKNYNKSCQKCTNCEKYVKMCSSKEDSICRYDAVKTTITTLAQVKTSDKNTPTVSTDILWSSTVSEKTTNNLVDPIIIAVVCVIVLLISIIIIAAILKRKKAFTTQRFSIIQESTERTPVSFGGALFRLQPGNVILGLHALLNPESPNNWRAVASELDVPYLQIRNFEAGNIDKAAEEMLHYWGTKNDATLDKLYQALRKRGRDDACTFLEENVELESVPETVV